MDWRDSALICLNGHLINSSMKENPMHNINFCKECGAKTINTCPKCNASIEGRMYYEDFFDTSEIDVPAYCHNCGNPYPWVENKLRAIKEILELTQELSEVEKEEFLVNVNSIITENPRAQIASLKISTAGKRIGAELWGMAKDIIVSIGTETAKKTMGI